MVVWDVRVEWLQQSWNVLLANGNSDVTIDAQLKSNRAVRRSLL